MDSFLPSLFIQHNNYLVVLSYLIATISAYASIDLARRVIYSSGASKVIWLLSGGATLGIGIWSMHFIAMLAHQFPIEVYYSTTLVIISVFISVVACISGYYLISRNSWNHYRFWFAGTLMGLGIVSMHYVGTEAIRPLDISYDMPLVIVSVIIAITASLVALWVGFRLHSAKVELSWKLKFLTSLIMAMAIVGMHYTGMLATKFSENLTMNAEKVASIDTTLLAWIVAIVTIAIFSFFFFSIVLNKVWGKYNIVQNAILDSATDGIVITDKSDRITHANPAFYHLMNLTGIENKYPNLHDYNDHFKEELANNNEFQLDINTFIFEVKKQPIQGESLNNSLWVIRNITESIQSKKQIEFLAYHDTLTNLPNRHLLDVTLQEWLQSNVEIGCLFFNVDRLKFINDTHGLQAGNSSLQHVSQFLATFIDEDDFLARIGGDEFIILVTGAHMQSLHEMANRCIQEIRNSFKINEVNIDITMSAGICTYPHEAQSADELLQFANLAMSESKKHGKNQVTSFNLAIKEENRRKLQLEEALSFALENKEFHLLYQPKILLETKKVIGAEALLRWTHPTLGVISPIEFIPIAEEKGMIHTIGEWVLREACKQWHELSKVIREPTVIAVNISPLQLTRDIFFQTLKDILKETQMNPKFLELEITESDSLASETHTKLCKLRDLDIQISLDDFGTGYSSFSHLKELPIHILKIDKSFVDQLLGNKGQEAIVRSIIQLGHNLNLKVLVEGVEEKEEVEWLKKEGCDMIQGYYFYKPLTPENLIEVLQQQTTPVQQTLS